MNTECIDTLKRGRYALPIVDMQVPKHAWVKGIDLSIAYMTSIHIWELVGSRMKETGRSLNANSWSPSSVKERNAKPRTSRTVSLELSRRPRSITCSGFVFFPTPFRNLVSARPLLSCAASNFPHTGSLCVNTPVESQT